MFIVVFLAFRWGRWLGEETRSLKLADEVGKELGENEGQGGDISGL